MDELSVNCLLYTDDQVILAPSACELQEMVNKMNDSVKKRGMKVNFGKTKIRMTECDILIEGIRFGNTKQSARVIANPYSSLLLSSLTLPALPPLAHFRKELSRSSARVDIPLSCIDIHWANTYYSPSRDHERHSVLDSNADSAFTAKSHSRF
ncbi:hypothetical protein EVAR_49910_1 [Eumeta japonica]|uniref:Reverse transcriptase domain-containing protein n=1 Tax=Eumeta variegata TaxID=151549 RepID=A0A4C1Y1B6_EUMVA|nr:hypothetical protein EVAR_49910_1 [Eumeta japonica]